MTPKEKRIAGQILYLASDDRHRLLLSDECEWQQKKLAEIARLVKLLPTRPFDPKKDARS